MEPRSQPPLIYSVSLATFDLHVGNTIAYTFPSRSINPPPASENNNNDETSSPSKSRKNSITFDPEKIKLEPVHPLNVIGGARLHDYCFPDGGHDVSSDEVSFLVRLKSPVSPFLDGQNMNMASDKTTPIKKNDEEREKSEIEETRKPEPQQEETTIAAAHEDFNENPDDENMVEEYSNDHNNNNNTQSELTLEESSPIASHPNTRDIFTDPNSTSRLTENVAEALGADSSPLSTLTSSSARRRKSFADNNDDDQQKQKQQQPSLEREEDFGYLSQPIPILYGSALYTRAADPKVERGALQRSVLVLSRVPLHKPILDYLRIKALPLLSNGPEYKNEDPRLRTLVDDLYKELCDLTDPCVSSYRIVAPLYAQLDAGKRIYLPRAGRYNSSHHPASHLVLMGYRSSVTHLLRLLGPTHSALLLYAMLARIPVMVIGKCASEVCNVVCACIHLCRPLPISIGHFAPYAPISVLDKLIAQAATTPFAVVGATNAFVAHKSFKGIVKLLLPSISEEVLASSAASGDASSARLQKKLAQSARDRKAQLLAENPNLGNSFFGDTATATNMLNNDGFAFVQYPSASNLHKVGPAKFLPKSFSIRVKRLVAFANEPDASEAHMRSLSLALNFALSLEIRTGYGDVGKAFNSGTGLVNVVNSPLRDFHSEEQKDDTTKPDEEQKEANNSITSASSNNSPSSVPTGTVEDLADLDDLEEDDDDADFDVIPSNDSVTMNKNNNNESGTNNNTNQEKQTKFSLGIFPALRSREEEARLMNSLEMALRSFVTERANERNTVFTIHKWFSACRTMLLPVAECSSDMQKTLFEDLMPSFTSLESAIRYDLHNLHNEKEDVGMLSTCEDMLLTLGEQQRLCRVDLGRFVEHYRRRAGASIDMLCSKQNSGARSRHINHLFCDTFSLPGIECYELQRETLLARASSATVTISPCETYNENQDDTDEPPAPFWENVEVSLSLSSRFVCLNAAEPQSIASKAMSKLSRFLPKSSPGKKQEYVNGYFAQQVIPIAAVSRIEVLANDDNNNTSDNILVNGANALASNVIQRDLHTIRLHLRVACPSTSSADSTNNNNSSMQKQQSLTAIHSNDFYSTSSLANSWRAKVDIRVSQRAGISQLLFLLVNKHHDFSQAIRKMDSNDNSSQTSNNSSPSSSSTTIEGFFIGHIKPHICPVALSGPSRLRDVPKITTDEVYENQRFYPIAGWSSKLMPHDPPAWSDRSGFRYKPKESVVLPPGYEWASEWALIPYYDELKVPDSFAREEQELMDEGGWKPGEEAWAYGTFWTLADFHAKKFPICSIRRRRWVRQRRFKPEVLKRLSDEDVDAAKKKEQEQQISSQLGGDGVEKSPVQNQQQSQNPNHNSSEKAQREENEVNYSLAFASHLKSLEHISDVKASLGEMKDKDNNNNNNKE